MRTSQLQFRTFKELPAEAELASHRLMLRANLIKRLGSGLYTWMPLGLLVLRKVEAIVRDEMCKIGALELLMPVVQPADLWKKTGRWAQFGLQMLKIQDRQQRDLCFAPTHEEVITEIAREVLRSYKQLPVVFFQINTKFRDEIRPRFGVMRAREFIMKDAYSFHTDKASLEKTYHVLYQAYTTIFQRLGLRFRAVLADSGAMGGAQSHEFHLLSEAGEDVIAYCPDSDYAANLERAEAMAPAHRADLQEEAQRAARAPGQSTSLAAAQHLGIPLDRMVKAAAVLISNGQFAMVLLRADHTLNAVKLAKLPELAGFRFANPAEIEQAFQASSDCLGPVGLEHNVLLIADRDVAVLGNFACAANKPGHYWLGVNFARDLPTPSIVADLRDVVEGDLSPDGKGSLSLCRGIEVGHIFQLGTKYTEAMDCSYVTHDGHAAPIEMGCYGIGVSRIVAAAIEQNHDERGIIFPPAMAPFTVAITPIAYWRSPRVLEAAEKLYAHLQASGVDVLLDDRDERPGSMFADMELIGVPFRFVVSEKNLDVGILECVVRSNGQRYSVPFDQALSVLNSYYRPQAIN